MCACVASLACFYWFFWQGELLLYGDAVAHINIARRVFDSRTPGVERLGTVWLPLPHLVSVPFIVNDWMWRSGVGGSIPSMIAYVFAVVGIFRLVRGRASRLAAWLAAGLLGLNPNLLYMQSTAMTESIFLATMIWAVVYFDEFVRDLCQADFSLTSEPQLPATKALERCGIVLAAAMLTRYDGWVLAFVIGCAAVAIVLRSAPTRAIASPVWDPGAGVGTAVRGVRHSLAAFLLLCALMPALWLAHNYAINYKPLDWWNGPYSAQAIEQRTGHGYPYPGKHNLWLAAKQFLKAAQLNFSGGFTPRRTRPSLTEMLRGWKTWFLLVLVAPGTLLAMRPRARRAWAWLLLWLPVPFYAYSIAYGSVPVFLPVWWPFSYYNVRYGLELLPAFAVFVALAVGFMAERLVLLERVILIGMLAGNYIVVAEATPICLREAQTNSVARMGLESQLSSVLATLPPNSTLLMYTGEYVGAVQSAGVHLRRVVNETGKIVWDAGLSCPAQVADYVIAVNGDAVAQAVAGNPRWLQKIAGFSTPGKPDVAVYHSTFPERQR